MNSPTDISGKLAIDATGLNDLRQAAKQNSPEALKAAAKQFEALFMNMMLKSMREASPQDGPFDNEQSKMYTTMMDQQLSQNLAKRGVGLADVLIRQLSNVVGTAPAASPGKDGAPTVLNQQGMAAYALGADALHTPSDAKIDASGDRSKMGHVRAFTARMEAHAEEASRSTGIPAKFMLGQAALESGWGKREIKDSDGNASHNLFGIKANSSWKGRVVTAVTTEYLDGVPQTAGEIPRLRQLCRCVSRLRQDAEQ
ncbi:flagellar assembly peptidoglycan hydrolase FlgJ [Undibacterium arcticum]|uniref:flagellar assembly peptidoglycan hydrolase FlgJ n=1 Tax=Undibacterium arcticum TaxID=1762892 RepID=UPI00361696AE